jgi:hypothetical protein
MDEHVAAIGATDATVQRLSVRQQTLLYSVCRPCFYCVEKLMASFEDGGYKYLFAGP